MPENDQERTEPATNKKRKEARDEGQAAKSTDLNSIITLFAAITLLSWLGGYIWKNLFEIFKMCLSSIPNQDLTFEYIQNHFILLSIQFIKIVLPFMFGIMIIGLLSNIMQVGYTITPKAILPKFSRISPAQGFHKIFSYNALKDFLKSLLKIFIIMYISYSISKDNLYLLLQLGDLEVNKIVESIGYIIIKIGTKISQALLIVAIIDYGYEWWSLEKNLRMTKQEIKDELKESEGNPLIKFRIKNIQRQLSMQRMMSDVPKADVIITNPTHLAVALKYDSGTMGAPKVVAKGARLIAEKIKKIASENNITIIENKPLARSLFKLCSIGQEIPIELYRAVAELLAYIFKLKGKKIA
ncbi:MAG: flagellar biosynthesis protein FlhB [Candidatus Firestonebacteria bacterium]|nr:flagellar biosynthesis protein FlhB [Candidatus Firestonebacteria bacterium]